MLKVNSSTQTKDMGMKRILDEIDKLKRKPFVKVGVQGSEAKEIKAGGDGEGKQPTLVEIATIHEYGGGTGNPPERSFIRKTVHTEAKKYKQITGRLKDQVLDPKSSMTTEKALDLLGLTVQKDIQNTIRNDEAGLDGPTPLSDAAKRARLNRNKATAAKVNRSGEPLPDGTPLFDTGQLIRSVTFEKNMGKGSKNER